METDNSWISIFISNLVKFQKSRQEKKRNSLEYFNMLPVDLAVDFIKSFYHLYIQSHTSAITNISLSNDESVFVSISANSAIHVWSLITKSQIYSIDHLDKDITVLQFTPDWQNLLIGTKSGKIRLLSFKESRVEFTFEGHRASIQEICLIPNSQLFISASLDLSIIMWNLATKRCEAYMKKHEAYVSCLHVSPNSSYFASGSWDHKVILWNIRKKSVIKTFGNLEKVVNSVCFSKDSRVLAAASGNIIFVFSLNDFSEKHLESHTCTVTKVLFSNAGLLISVSFDKSIKVWDTSNYQVKKVIMTSPNHCTSSVLAESGKSLILGLNNGQIKLVSFNESNTDLLLPGHNKDVFLVRISPNCRVLASTCCLYWLALWDVKLKNCLVNSKKLNDPINSFEFCKDSTQLVSGYMSGSIEILDLSTLSILKLVEPCSITITCVIFWNNEKIIASSQNNEINIWTIKTKEKTNIPHKNLEFCVKTLKLSNFLLCQYKNNLIKCFKFPNLD